MMRSSARQTTLGMMRRVAVHEIRLATRDGRIRVLLVLVALLGAVALVVGQHHHAEREALIDAAQQLNRDQFIGQGERNPHSGAHFGLHGFKPEPALGALERGVDDYAGSFVLLEPHRPNMMRDAAAQDATSLARFGRWTLAGALQLLVPLLIIFLAAPSIAGERERETLRMLVAEGAPMTYVVLAKAAGVVAVVLVALIPAVVAGAIALVAWPGPLELGRLAVFTAGHAIYLAIFVFIALAISAVARTSQAAIVLGLAFWALAAVIGPRAAAEVARASHTLPTAFEHAQATLTLAHDMKTWTALEERVKAEAMARYQVTSVDDLPVNYAGIALDLQEQLDAPRFDREYGRLHDILLAQQATLELGAVVAPLVAVQSISTAAAGNGLEDQIAFWRYSEDYRRRMVKIMNDHMATNSRSTQGWDYKVGAAVWKLAPVFDYQLPTVREVVTRSLRPFGFLVGWLAIAVALCMHQARRLPRRALA